MEFRDHQQIPNTENQANRNIGSNLSENDFNPDAMGLKATITIPWHFGSRRLS